MKMERILERLNRSNQFTKKPKEIEIQKHMRGSYVVLGEEVWLIKSIKPQHFLHREFSHSKKKKKRLLVKALHKLKFMVSISHQIASSKKVSQSSLRKYYQQILFRILFLKLQNKLKIICKFKNLIVDFMFLFMRLGKKLKFPNTHRT